MKGMKFNLIEYDSKYEKQMKHLYMTNITRTALPNGVIYQKNLFQKHGLKLITIYIILAFMLREILKIILGEYTSIFITFIFGFVFIIQGYVNFLVKLLAYYYCYKVFTNDFKNADKKYNGKKKNRLWLIIGEEQDDVLGMVALNEDQSLLSQSRLWELFESKVNKKREQIRTCELQRMSVSPKAIGLGLGKVLTDTFLQYAEQQGYDFAYLTTYSYNKQAVKLYSSRGFTHELDFPFDKVHELLCLQVSFMIKKFTNDK